MELGKQESFFFQEEDGIRYVAVTGVQTCALPILKPAASRPPRGGVVATRSRKTDPGRRPPPLGAGMQLINRRPQALRALVTEILDDQVLRNVVVLRPRVLAAREGRVKLAKEAGEGSGKEAAL